MGTGYIRFTEEEKRIGTSGSVDRRLRRKINEKKEAQGLHPAE